MADETTLARAAWSRLTEPGDEAAGILLGAVGPVDALAWLRGAAGQVLPSSPAALTRLGPGLARALDRWSVRLADLDPARDLARVEEIGGWFLTPEDAGWPAQVADLGDAAPVGLWGRGSRASLASRGVVLVGSRAATPYGAHVAADLAVGCVDAGLVVVSGGAYGIDIAAHRGALAGAGVSVAVMAGGVDRLYPSGNAEALGQLVARGGALVAEVPPGSAPTRHRFLGRNRVIAALGAATVVVEAAHRSGALSTASHAARLGRPLGAVPGPVTSAASAGCHRLLRESAAVCVTSSADAVELAMPIGSVLGPEEIVGNGSQGLLDGLRPLSARVVDALPARGGRTVAAIAREAGLTAGEVRSELGLLELGGRVTRNGEQWRRAGA